MPNSESKSSVLYGKYQRFIGKDVMVTAPGYVALNPKDESRILKGTVLALAWREAGRMAGTSVDMVIRSPEGIFRTIALSRIIGCRELAETSTRPNPTGGAS